MAPVVDRVDTPAVVAVAAAKNATNVARSVTLLGIAPRAAARMVEGTKATKAGMAAEDTEVVVKAARPAILAVDTDTCRATAPRDRNATTVSHDT